jgi:hypothetical protein
MAKKSLVSKKEKAPKKEAAQKEAPAKSTVVAFDAKDLARNAALDQAEKRDQVGGFVSVDFDDDNRVATYLFEANLAGYKGWRWCITIAKVDTDAQPTICDVVVLPGPDALRAPEWIPYRDRILPGDVGVGDIVPSSLDDTRLVAGQQALPQDEELDTAMAIELGLGRARVLSIEGRDQAAKRWYDGERGPNAPLPSQHQSHVTAADSLFRSQDHCEQPLAYAQMRSRLMMHA